MGVFALPEGVLRCDPPLGRPAEGDDVERGGLAVPEGRGSSLRDAIMLWRFDSPSLGAGAGGAASFLLLVDPPRPPPRPPPAFFSFSSPSTLTLGFEPLFAELPLALREGEPGAAGVVAAAVLGGALEGAGVGSGALVDMVDVCRGLRLATALQDVPCTQRSVLLVLCAAQGIVQAIEMPHQQRAPRTLHRRLSPSSIPERAPATVRSFLPSSSLS